MNDRDERYIHVSAKAAPALASAIRKRMADEPGFTQAELVRRSGVSHPTVRALMRGEPGNRGRTEVRQVSAALGWTPDSIERLLAGNEPLAATRQDDRLDQIDRKLDRITAVLEGVADRLELLEGERR
jgi:transcriptional regulator with XRE-family HTH domain